MFASVTHVMKIGRNNFKPPPAVESSVVRLVPKRPRPDISWEEWDGLLRIAFVRKNRTLRAGFLGTGIVMELLEQNYRTWCAQNDVPLEDSLPEEAGVVGMDTDENALEVAGGDEEWEGIMEIDEETPDFLTEVNGSAKLLKRDDLFSKRRRKGKVAELVREKVKRVLEENGLADRRARQCDEGDFLRLLWSMNKEGIHFS